ncbi:hypothetical protein D3C83_76130 [compost metagenome]
MPTYRTPAGLHAMDRAPGTCSANRSMLNPGGSVMRARPSCTEMGFGLSTAADCADPAISASAVISASERVIRDLFMGFGPP